MTTLVALFPFLLLVQTQAADSLRVLGATASDSTLIAQARAKPQAIRDAIAAAFAIAARDSVSPEPNGLGEARRLASAYSLVWRDSFLLRQVAAFASWRPARRVARVWADSVRRAGVVAYSRDGPSAAMALWRRSLARAHSVGDSACEAAALGNIGAAFWRQHQLDSARLYLERSRRIASRLADLGVAANALGLLASVSADRGDVKLARAQYRSAIGVRERIGDTRGIAADKNNLGLLDQADGNFDGARREFDAAYQLNLGDGRADAAATNLVNLAGLASLTGEFGDAEELYHRAIALWRERGSRAELAEGLIELGRLEVRRGDYDNASAALSEAIGILDGTGPIDDVVSARAELAQALEAKGDLRSAIDITREAERKADSAHVSGASDAMLRLEHADLAAMMNDFALAESLYIDAMRGYRAAGDRLAQAEALAGRAALRLNDDNPPAEVTQWLERALRAQAAAGDARGVAVTRLSLGAAARMRGDLVTARRQIDRALAVLQRLSDPVALAAALEATGTVELAAHHPVLAEKQYRRGLRALEGRVAPDISWRLHSGLATSRIVLGDLDGGARELRNAVAEIEQSTRSLPTGALRSTFRSDKLDVYAQLAGTEVRRGDLGAGFGASEQLRAREMLDLLARGRIAPDEKTARSLVAREQDLRRRMTELTRDLEAIPDRMAVRRGAETSTDSDRNLLLRHAQDEYAALLSELRDAAPEHERLISSPTVTWREIAARLEPNEAFIEYLIGDSSATAFVVDKDTIEAIQLDVGRRQLTALVEFARQTLEPRVWAAGDSLWGRALHRLHGYLIAPIERRGILRGKTRLLIVPHGCLHYLPFAGLIDDERQFLVQNYEIAETPSGSVWSSLGARRDQGPPPEGVLVLAPEPEELPGSRREASALRRMVSGNGLILVGEEATEAAFHREAPRHSVIHLASNGVLNRHNPFFSYVKLASDPTGADDGRLEVHEVFGMRLRADLVVLAACETALGSGADADLPPGDDWIGFTRAFLHAGAKRVVASLWLVDDWATATLMEQLYGRYRATGDAVLALASAQRNLLSRPQTANPFYWAGFVLVEGGDARR